MLELSIAPPQTAAPPLPELSGPGVEVWRQHDGAVAAYGGTTGSEHWMHLPGIGTFRFGAREQSVTAYVEDGVAADDVEDSFRRTVLPMALQVLGIEVLHASAVRGRDGVIALCAVSETGKSTLAYAFSRRGYPLWADDAVGLELTDEAVSVLPLPLALYLRPASAAFFGEGDRVAADGDADGAVPLAGLCVLERDEDEGAPAVTVDRPAPADAFPALLTHAYCFTLADVERKRRMMESYLELVTRVPVLRVRFRAGLERVPEILAEIEAALGAAPLDEQ